MNDEYVKLAQRDGYRSRAAYKLLEIDERDALIRPGMIVVDLGATPGSWSQVVVERLKGNGRVIALDILEMQPISTVEFLQGDFRETEVLSRLEQTLAGKKADLVLSDMAPNMSGVGLVDQARAMDLAELSLAFALEWLKPGGNFLVKVFIGSGFEDLVRDMRPAFEKVATRKPKASRGRSAETYLLGMKRKAAD